MPGRGLYLKREGGGEADLLDQRQSGGEIRFALAGEADDEIGGEGEIGPRPAQALDQRQIVRRAMLAVHRRQDAVRARLHRQMQEGHQLRHLAMGGDQVLVHIGGMGGGVADARQIGDLAPARAISRARPQSAPSGPAP